MVQGLGDLHERTYIEAQMQRILEPLSKGRKIVAGRSICQVGSIRDGIPEDILRILGSVWQKESSG